MTDRNTQKSTIPTSDVVTGMYENRVYSNEGFPELLSLIPSKERIVLDIGCGAGDNARLLSQRGKTVYGVTISEEEAEQARPFLADVRCGNVETMKFDFAVEQFDAILLSHVLEHLIEPDQLLRRLASHLRPGGHIYIALPNVLYYQQRLQFLIGRFRYTESGLMDQTHLRFFNFNTAQDLVRNSGYKIANAKALGSVPLWPLRRWIGTNTVLDRIGTKQFPNLFGFHILVVGERP